MCPATRFTATTPWPSKQHSFNSPAESARMQRGYCFVSTELNDTPRGYIVDPVKKSSRPANRRTLPSAARVVVFCAVFLGLLSMHVLTGAAFGPGHHGQSSSADVAATPFSMSAHEHGEPQVPAAETGGGHHGLGLGECALLVACVLGLVVFAHKLGLPGSAGRSPRAGPSPYRPSLVAFNDSVFRAPSPQQLSICRR